MQKIAQVIVDIKAHSVDKVFDYLIPDGLDVAIGRRVTVPFGRNRTLSGYVVKITSKQEPTEYKLKAIQSVSDIQFLNEELVELAQVFATETGSFLTSLLQTMLPKDITRRSKKYVQIVQKVNEIKVSGRAKKQLEVYEAVVREQLPMAVSALNKKYGGPTIKELIKKEAFVIEEMLEVDWEKQFSNTHQAGTSAAYPLRDEQRIAIETILEEDKEAFLLQGVTGSGKTEVFLQITAEMLHQGKTTLILVPEIGLTPQMMERFNERFGSEQVAILHSRLTDSVRFKMWERIKSGAARIVLGTRSAVFSPLENIGAIIIDEEHDQSYKQENMPSYHARDIASWRAKHHQAKLILGSATPSMETFVRADKGLYQLLYLKERKNKFEPNVHIVDMKDSLGEVEYRYFSKELSEAIKGALSRKEQVLLLMNRRGYAPTVQCHFCGATPECPNCDVSLVYHQYTKKLSCHYCDYQKGFESNCEHCQNEYSFEGVGIQLIEAELKSIFPEAIIKRADRDTIKSFVDYEEMYESFRNQEADILLGTQMITKGFDFPNVTVVGILEADQLLSAPDFRASEKSYQLLRQAIGRTGRGDKKGDAYLQLYDTEHELLADIVKDDYFEFAHKELTYRLAYKHPPYWHMSDIIVHSEDQQVAMKTAMYMHEQLLKLSKVATVYRPAPAFIARRNNRYYFHILIKYKNSALVMPNIQKLIGHVLENHKNVLTFVQVNPISFI